MQLLDVALKLSYICEHDSWITALPTTQLSLSFMYPSYLILSYHPRHLQIPVESQCREPRSPPSNLRCALQRHQGYRRIHPGQYGHLSEMMGEWMGIAIYIYISTYNIHINIHIWVYLLRWICGEIIAWVLPKQNVAVDIVNVNILIKVPPWNSDFQWFSLIFTGLGQAPIVANQNFQRHGKHDLSRLIFRKDSLIIMNHHKGF